MIFYPNSFDPLGNIVIKTGMSISILSFATKNYVLMLVIFFAGVVRRENLNNQMEAERMFNVRLW